MGSPRRVRLMSQNRVPFAVDEQHGLFQASAVGRRMRIGDVGGVVQVPCIAGTKARYAKRGDQGVEIGRRPKRGVGRHRRRSMRRPEPASARDVIVADG